MIAPRCLGCGRVVVSMIGQSERLDSYLLEPGGPPPESAGHWHARCLVGCPLGGAWAAARMRNLVEVRGYAVVDRVEGWCVLEDPRDGVRMGLSDLGPLLVLPRATALVRRAWGAGYRARKGEYNLHLPVPDLVEAMQAALVRDGACSMAMLFDRLELWSCLQHADALADARFVFDEELREAWGAEWLCAGVEYDVVVAPALLPYCL